MLQTICPKLPSRDINKTKKYYINDLHFKEESDYGNYLIVSKDNIEIHFFEFKDLNELENYGQVYIRVGNIDNVYRDLVDRGIKIHPNGKLKSQPWGQKEFSLLDPDHNLLTFGEGT